MNNKTIEIIIHLLGHLKDHDFDIKNLKKFSENLIFRGYNENEVAEAFGWLFDKLNLLTAKTTEISEQHEKSVRILNEYERMKITPEVYGYLLRLRNLSIIDAVQMEKIIDYCMLLGSHKVDESDINEIMTTVLFEEG